MDSTGISLSGFELATPLSGVRAEAHAGAGIMRMAPDTPLTADLSASLNTEEIKLLYPQLIPAALDDRIVRIKLSAAGNRWATSKRRGWTSRRPDISTLR